MLVREHDPFPIDTRIRFEIFMPDEKGSVIGSGLVVRHTTDGERQKGFGVKFTDFVGDGRERLDAYIDSKLSSRPRLFPYAGV